jgi:hypothetical protein
MELPDRGADQAWQKLTELRETLLTLHKALLDSERTAYELVYGPVSSPAAFLQLLINDPWFAWLQPITTLIVQVDETLAAKKPPAPIHDLQQLILDMRALLSPSREVNGFWKRYSAVVDRDPAVTILHDQIERQLTG